MNMEFLTRCSRRVPSSCEVLAQNQEKCLEALQQTKKNAKMNFDEIDVFCDVDVQSILFLLAVLLLKLISLLAVTLLQIKMSTQHNLYRWHTPVESFQNNLS